MSTATLPKSESTEERAEEQAAYWGGLNLKVDREKGIIPGVKILGHESLNRRRYTTDAMRNAVGLYEGARVNVNHTKTADGQRSYQDRLGTVKKVHYREGQGLFGDLHYNPEHSVAKQLAWDAENAPNNAGFSPAHLFRYKRDRDGIAVIDEIVKVFSVDLVADPATNKGLRESINDEEPSMSVDLTAMSVEQILQARPEVETAILAKAKESQESKDLQIRLTQLEAENKTLKAAESSRVRRDAVDAKLNAAGIEAVMDGAIRDVAYGLEDIQLDKYIASLQGIAQKAPKLPAGQKPKSAEQTSGIESYQPTPEGKRRWS